MKKSFFVFVSLTMFVGSFFFLSAAHASMEGDAEAASIQSALAGECENFSDNGGVRYCGCSLELDGKKYDFKLCKTRAQERLSKNFSVDVDLQRGVCNIGQGLFGKQNTCAIKTVKKPDACNCLFTPNDNKSEKPAGIIIPFGEEGFAKANTDASLSPHQKQRLKDAISDFDQTNYVCPLAPGKLLGVAWQEWNCSQPVYNETLCCCTLVEKGSATSKYSCAKKTGPGGACAFTDKVYPVPANGSCDAYTTTGKVTADKQNPGIGKDKLLSEAATLNQLPQFRSPAAFIGQVIKVMLSLLGSIALGLYVWSGVLWTTAAGNSERIETSKKIIIWTTAGVAAILSSYVLVQFVFKTLG